MALKEQLTAQQLTDQRKQLAQQVLAEQQRLALQNAQTSRQQLSQQLAQARLQSNLNRDQLAQQAFLQQRAIDQQAASRGLGSSGARNVAGLQAQLAQNQGVNALAQQEAMVEQEAMNTSRAITTGLTDQLRQAQLMNLEQVVGADEQLYNLQQQERAEKSNLLMELSALLQDGTLTPDSMANFMALAGYDMSDFTEEQQKALEDISPDLDFMYGDTKLEARGPNLFTDIAKELTRYNDPTMYLAWLGNNLFGNKVKLSDSKGIQASLVDLISGKKSYNIGGQKISGSKEEVLSEISNMYAGKQYFGNQITLGFNKDSDIRFYVGGKAYSTYNKAKAAVEKNAGINVK